MSKFSMDERWDTPTRVAYKETLRPVVDPEQRRGLTSLYGREDLAGSSLRAAHASWLAPKHDAPKVPTPVQPELAKTRSQIGCLALNQPHQSHTKFDQSYAFFRSLSTSPDRLMIDHSGQN